MSMVERAARCTPDAVFAVLAEGWFYATWVVGASRIREVDDDWPSVGSRLHHSIGVWPLVLDDHTKVLEVDRPHLLRLQARAWPAGEATVTVTLVPTPAGCMMTIEEHASAGLAQLVPKPIMDAMLTVRNKETLNRLAMLAEGRTSVDPTHDLD